MFFHRSYFAIREYPTRRTFSIRPPLYTPCAKVQDLGWPLRLILTFVLVGLRDEDVLPSYCAIRIPLEGHSPFVRRCTHHAPRYRTSAGTQCLVATRWHVNRVAAQLRMRQEMWLRSRSVPVISLTLTIAPRGGGGGPAWRAPHVEPLCWCWAVRESDGVCCRRRAFSPSLSRPSPRKSINNFLF